MENRPQKPSNPPKDLSFVPVTEGLGFHPFSDGLPYAPLAKTQSGSMVRGSGAIAAGPPTIMMPRPVPARVSVPVATQPLPQVQPQVQQAQVQTQAQPQPQLLDQPQFGLIYLVKRVFAYLFDSIINISLCVAAFILAMLRLNLNPDSLLNPNILLLPMIFLFVFNWALITAQEVAFGTSLGKRVFGLAVNGSAAVTFLRAFFFLPSVGFCGVGLLWALFDRKKRCWHDVAADLQPIEIAQL